MGHNIVFLMAAAFGVFTFEVWATNVDTQGATENLCEICDQTLDSVQPALPVEFSGFLFCSQHESIVKFSLENPKNIRIKHLLNRVRAHCGIIDPATGEPPDRDYKLRTGCPQIGDILTVTEWELVSGLC